MSNPTLKMRPTLLQRRYRNHHATYSRTKVPLLPVYWPMLCCVYVVVSLIGHRLGFIALSLVCGMLVWLCPLYVLCSVVSLLRLAPLAAHRFEPVYMYCVSWICVCLITYSIMVIIWYARERWVLLLLMCERKPKHCA